MAQKISRVNVKAKIMAQGNMLMSGTFIKKDQTERKMTFRMGVTKGLRGGKNNVMRDDRSYLTVYDMKKSQFRSLNLGTLSEIKIAGVKYEVV